MGHGKIRHGVVLATVMILLASCRSIEEPNSSFFGEDCQETDPASSGCVDIQGTVTGSRGQPLSHVDVAMLDASTSLSPDFVFTDSDGNYELRLVQVSESATSLTITLKATARASDGTELASTTSSVLVQIAAIGETPDPVTVNFTLPVN